MLPVPGMGVGAWGVEVVGAVNKRQRKKAWKKRNHIPYGYRVVVSDTSYHQIVITPQLVDVAIMPRYLQCSTDWYLDCQHSGGK